MKRLLTPEPWHRIVLGLWFSLTQPPSLPVPPIRVSAAARASQLACITKLRVCCGCVAGMRTVPHGAKARTLHRKKTRKGICTAAPSILLAADLRHDSL